jgi:hypothetical protein
MPRWTVGAARDLPLSDSDSWDGDAAKAAIFAWAGGDDFSPAKAKRGFLVYDAEADDQRGSYKLPFATAVEGELTAVLGGVRAAASRLPQTDIPDDVKDKARAVIDGYLPGDDGEAESERAERRIRPGDPRRIEYRPVPARAEVAEDGGGGFSGYASTFWHVDSFGTAFAPGAFRKSVRERGDRVLVLWQHDPYLPIGRPTVLKEDKAGLRVEARISEGTQYGRDAMALLRDGVPLGLSVGFRTVRERPATEDDAEHLDFEKSPKELQRLYKDDPGAIYVIEEAKLYEFSAVSFPANEFAEIEAVRSDAQADALLTVLADLRAGRASSTHRHLIADLVAAWQAAPDGARPAPRADSKAPRRARDLYAELTVVAAQYGLPLESVA